MAKRNWMEKISASEGAVNDDYNPFNHTLTSPSPSLDFIFGHNHGIPLGYSVVLWGPPKGGKTVICNAIIGKMHQDDPEGWALKFDTELREQGQLTQEESAKWGIDRDRYKCFSVNTPDLIYDKIAGEVAQWCEDGLPLKVVVIDSLNSIQGRRAMNATSVMTQQIGDNALTNKEGLKRILPVQRKYKFALLLTSHVGAEMDMAEQMRGNKVKMSQGFGTQHHAEYFVYVEADKTKGGRTDILGNKFENDGLTDMNDNAEKTGHKIRCIMKDSSMGPKGRVGEFTLDYKKGIINVHEEVFVLGVNRGIIERPNNRTYVFGDRTWDSKQAMIDAIRDEVELQKAILVELRRRDGMGMFAAQDRIDAAENGDDISQK